MVEQKGQQRMNTKLTLCLILTVFVARSSSGQTNSVSDGLPKNCVISGVRSNVFVGFSSPLLNGQPRLDAGIPIFPSDAPIKFGFGTTQKAPLDVFVLNKQYGCSVYAKSSQGSLLEKTKEGERHGVKMNEVKRWDINLFNTQRAGKDLNQIQQVRPTVALISACSLSESLPPPEALFNINKPGKYEVWVEIQCFVGPYGKAAATNVQLVRFPPVHLLVVKLDE